MPTADGEGKKALILTEYLGATKQAPVIIKALADAMPRLSYVVSGSEDIIRTDLNAYGIAWDKMRSTKTENVDAVVKLTTKQPQHAAYQITRHLRQAVIAYIWIDALKYEPRPLLDPEQQAKLKRHYHLDAERVIVAGSISKYETEKLLAQYAKARKLWKENMQLIIAPRLAEVVPAVEEQCAQIGIQASRDTTLEGRVEAVIVETEGVLADLYSVADVAVIGDTFSHNSMGQNPLEPAFYGKRIVSGDRWVNNATAFEGLQKAGLLTAVSMSDLAAELCREPAKEQFREQQMAAAAFIRSQQGVARRFAQEFQHHLYR